MPKLILLCGIPGSGKSTYAQDLASQNNRVKVFSSDEVRLELVGDVSDMTSNSHVFNVLYKRAIDALFKGFDVVIDSTNINRRARKQALDHFAWVDAKIKNKIERECIVMCTPYDKCITNDTKRTSHHVPAQMISVYANMFEVPLKAEGFDKISFHFFDALPSTEDLLSDLKKFDAASKSKMKFYNHSSSAQLLFQFADNFDTFGDQWKNNIIHALYLHEVSKPLTTRIGGLVSNNGQKQPCVDSRWSAYMAMCTQELRDKIMMPETIALINYHSVFYGSKNKDEVLALLEKEDPELRRAVEQVHYEDKFESDLHRPVAEVFLSND